MCPLGCGSSVMRAKTPLYLIRPTNASDSLLGLGANSLLGKVKESDDLSIFAPTDEDRRRAGDDDARSLGSVSADGTNGSRYSKGTRQTRGERAGKRAKV